MDLFKKTFGAECSTAFFCVGKHASGGTLRCCVDGFLLCGKNMRRSGRFADVSRQVWEARPRVDAVCAKSFLKSWRRWVRLCPLPFLSRQIDCGLTRRDAFCLCFGLNVWAEGVCVGLA